MSIVLSGGSKSAKISNYRDVRLSTIKRKDDKSVEYEGKFFHLFDKNNSFQHEKIKYGVTFTNDLMTIKDISSIPFYQNDEVREFENVRRMNSSDRKFFIYSYVQYPYIYMDFFEENIYDFLRRRNVPIKTRITIFSFIFEALNIIKNQGKCFTDIKPEQVLVRGNSERTGKYHSFNIGNETFEIALADLDYKLCTINNSYVSTYQLPNHIINDVYKRNPSAEATLQTIYALGATAMNIFGINDDKYLTQNVSKSQILRDLEMLKSLNVPSYVYETVKIALYDISAFTKWNDLAKKYFP